VQTNQEIDREILMGPNWNVKDPEKELVQYFKLYTLYTLYQACPTSNRLRSTF
jgi:hypothetical protein